MSRWNTVLLLLKSLVVIKIDKNTYSWQVFSYCTERHIGITCKRSVWRPLETAACVKMFCLFVCSFETAHPCCYQSFVHTILKCNTQQSKLFNYGQSMQGVAACEPFPWGNYHHIKCNLPCAKQAYVSSKRSSNDAPYWSRNWMINQEFLCSKFG